jgi:ubiquitin carboxyl-terminal hydrolase 16/45
MNEEEMNENNVENQMDIDDNNNNNDSTGKIDDITTLLNDALIQNDNNFKLEAMQSLAHRRSSTTDEESCSLQSFLLKFTSPELLTGNNKFGCEHCTRSAYPKLNSNASSLPKEMKTVYTQATKQYLICELPAVLTIHLKRFQQHGFRLEKVNKHVNFPLELDMAPYTSKMCTNLNSSNRVIYSLYGVVEHSGRLNGGHYTAYVKVRQRQNLEKFLGKKRLTVLKPSDCDATEAMDSPNTNEGSSWYYISDSHVSEVQESKILKIQAYILFYERLTTI